MSDLSGLDSWGLAWGNGQAKGGSGGHQRLDWESGGWDTGVGKAIERLSLALAKCLSLGLKMSNLSSLDSWGLAWGNGQAKGGSRGHQRLDWESSGWDTGVGKAIESISLALAKCLSLGLKMSDLSGLDSWGLAWGNGQAKGGSGGHQRLDWESGGWDTGVGKAIERLSLAFAQGVNQARVSQTVGPQGSVGQSLGVEMVGSGSLDGGSCVGDSGPAHLNQLT